MFKMDIFDHLSFFFVVDIWTRNYHVSNILESKASNKDFDMSVVLECLCLSAADLVVVVVWLKFINLYIFPCLFSD